MNSWWQLTYISLIIGDQQGILDQQLRLYPMNLLKIIIMLIIFIVVIYVIKLKRVPSQPKP